MGKLFILSVFVLLSFSVSAQNNDLTNCIDSTEPVVTCIDINTIPTVSVIDESIEKTALKRIERISADPNDQKNMILMGKSQDIISVKTYIRILQMKRKETLMS